jgi:hypothetical protein
VTAAGPWVVATGWLVAAWCVGFAVLNVVLETSHRFEEGPYAAYAAGLGVMSWVVFALKLLGAAVALWSLRSTPPASPTVLSMLLWSATALLSLYAVGSVVEAVGMLTGLRGDAGDVTFAGVVYVLFFILGAAGYSVLAASFARRFRVGRSAMLIGLFAAPVALGLLLVAIPMLLVAVHVMPAY